MDASVATAALRIRCKAICPTSVAMRPRRSGGSRSKSTPADRSSRDPSQRATADSASNPILGDSPNSSIYERYREWDIERAFRTSKSLFATRPIFHKLDETIRGQCVVQLPCQSRPARVSWPDILADLDLLTETEVEQDGKRFLLRAPPRPAASLAPPRAAGSSPCQQPCGHSPTS